MTAVFRSNLPSVLITGANRGLGLGLAKEYSQKGYNVFATSRKTGPADIKDLAPYAVAIHPLDLLDPTLATLATLPATLSRYTPSLQVLINNAGTMIPDKVGALSADSLLAQFKVNAMGPALVTQTLTPHLTTAGQAGGAKVVNISAILASLTDNLMPGKLPGYRASKTAQNALTVALAKELAGKGILVFGLHPGFVATRMSGMKGELSVEQSAGLVAKVVDAANKEVAGKMVNQAGKVMNW
ncbi:hypothetical protein BCR44DRAFT_1417625 [Catenaria anguillulae PL171]|uniref:Uncharacterized protein n=1 Tax=Catenaria anguillulae PL171 TaxID=765915 RepID=A0A1Y2H8H7_9FUNG|nr:hypothetical protein BCR44DRAFT_1417625 [Catenaria anguillulae PL171]